MKLVSENLNEFINEKSLPISKSKPLTPKELGELLARTQSTKEQEMATEVFSKWFRKLNDTKGKAEVKKQFEKATNLELRSFGPGTYVIIYE